MFPGVGFTGCIQAGFEYLWSRGTYNLSEQPVPVPGRACYP